MAGTVFAQQSRSYLQPPGYRVLPQPRWSAVRRPPVTSAESSTPADPGPSPATKPPRPRPAAVARTSPPSPPRTPMAASIRALPVRRGFRRRFRYFGGPSNLPVRGHRRRTGGLRTGGTGRRPGECFATGDVSDRLLPPGRRDADDPVRTRRCLRGVHPRRHRTRRDPAVRLRAGGQRPSLRVEGNRRELLPEGTNGGFIIASQGITLPA